MHRRILLAALAVMAAAPAAAHAGEPFTVGEGKNPHLTVDPGGTAHVVWVREDSGLDQTEYCRIPRGATACEVKTILPTSAFSESPTDTGAPFILRASDGKLYIVSQRYVSSDVFLWESADNGANWSAPRKIYNWSNSTDFGEPAFSPLTGELTFTVANTERGVFSAKTDGSEAGVDAHATLPNGGVGSLSYDLEAVPTPGDTGMVAIESSLSKSYFWRMAPGGNPSTTASWSAAPTEIGPTNPADLASLASGPAGAFVLHPADGAMQVFKWNGTNFGAPVFSIAERGYLNDIVVGNGGVGAIWRRNGSPNRLRFALSSDGGGSFATRTIALQDDVFSGLDVSLANDNGGFYVYAKGNPETGARDFIRVGDLTEVAEPVVTPPPTGTTPPPPPPAAPDPAFFGYPGVIYPGPTRSASVSDRDKIIRFGVPRHCVRPGQRFRVRLTWTRKKRKGNLFVKVRRSDFYIGSRRVKIDRKAPFSQLLTVVASQRRGSTIQLRARAFIKVRRGKSPTKSIRTTIRVCN